MNGGVVTVGAVTQHVLVINGVNLGRLGLREPDVYGATTFPELAQRLVAMGAELGLDVEVRQRVHVELAELEAFGVRDGRDQERAMDREELGVLRRPRRDALAGGEEALFLEPRADRREPLGPLGMLVGRPVREEGLVEDETGRLTQGPRSAICRCRARSGLRGHF